MYRVTLGRDEYLGTAEEVVAFLARGVGSPAREPRAYMKAVAARLATSMRLEAVPHEDATAFLEALAERGVLRLEPAREPSAERVDREAALGDGPIAFSEGVEPGDIDLP